MLMSVWNTIKCEFSSYKVACSLMNTLIANIIRLLIAIAE